MVLVPVATCRSTWSWWGLAPHMELALFLAVMQDACDACGHSKFLAFRVDAGGSLGSCA